MKHLKTFEELKIVQYKDLDTWNNKEPEPDYSKWMEQDYWDWQKIEDYTSENWSDIDEKYLKKILKIPHKKKKEDTRNSWGYEGDEWTEHMYIKGNKKFTIEIGESWDSRYSKEIKNFILVEIDDKRVNYRYKFEDFLKDFDEKIYNEYIQEKDLDQIGLL